MKEKVLEGFNNDNGFIKNNGFKILELNDEIAKLEYIVKDEGLNSIGIVHGGVLFGLCDTTAGCLACMSGYFPLTVNSNISYLNPISKGKLTAIAKKVKIGKTLGVYRVEAYDEKNKIICTSDVTMFFKKD